jgi:hypothetical protein
VDAIAHAAGGDGKHAAQLARPHHSDGAARREAMGGGHSAGRGELRASAVWVSRKAWRRARRGGS